MVYIYIYIYLVREVSFSRTKFLFTCVTRNYAPSICDYVGYFVYKPVISAYRFCPGDFLVEK